VKFHFEFTNDGKTAAVDYSSEAQCLTVSQGIIPSDWEAVSTLLRALHLTGYPL
jgi:hypothetical protein